MDKKDYKLPLSEKMGDDLNRRQFLAESVCWVLGFTPRSGIYAKVYDESAGITYGRYRLLLGMCYRKETNKLRVEVNALGKQEAAV